jgi:hypothetical protein
VEDTMDISLAHGNDDPVGQKLATGLGWFSILLGILELFGARRLASALGMSGKENLVRAYGARELVKGVGILSSKDPTPWLWGRVAGDALDLGTLAAHYTDTNPKKENVALAIANVAAVTALDVYCAQRLGSKTQPQLPAHDYSDRIGFPQSPQQMLGAASDFEVPRDYRTPPELQPWTAR